jgi:hypothetical protein
VLSTGYAYLDPFIALAALGLIVLICRWVFSSPPRKQAAPTPAARADYGLLQPVTVVRTRDDAEMLREVLRSAGIRGTVTETEGAYAVLVFPSDAGAARALVRS